MAKRTGKQLTRHHIRNISRYGCGCAENIVRIPQRTHRAWHELFGNLTPEEAIEFIHVMFSMNKAEWSYNDIVKVREYMKEVRRVSTHYFGGRTIRPPCKCQRKMAR